MCVSCLCWLNRSPFAGVCVCVCVSMDLFFFWDVEGGMYMFGCCTCLTQIFFFVPSSLRCILFKLRFKYSTRAVCVGVVLVLILM